MECLNVGPHFLWRTIYPETSSKECDGFMAKENCWEFMKCGREVGGSRAAGLGVCPVALSKDCDGINGGRNAGRICWAIAGTLCDGKVAGKFMTKIRTCLNCEFYTKTVKEEGPKITVHPCSPKD